MATKAVMMLFIAVTLTKAALNFAQVPLHPQQVEATP